MLCGPISLDMMPESKVDCRCTGSAIATSGTFVIAPARRRPGTPKIMLRRYGRTATVIQAVERVIADRIFRNACRTPIHPYAIEVVMDIRGGDGGRAGSEINTRIARSGNFVGG